MTTSKAASSTFWLGVGIAIVSTYLAWKFGKLKSKAELIVLIDKERQRAEALEDYESAAAYRDAIKSLRELS